MNRIILIVFAVVALSSPVNSQIKYQEFEKLIKVIHGNLPDSLKVEYLGSDDDPHISIVFNPNKINDKPIEYFEPYQYLVFCKENKMELFFLGILEWLTIERFRVKKSSYKLKLKVNSQNTDDVIGYKCIIERDQGELVISSMEKINKKTHPNMR